MIASTLFLLATSAHAKPLGWFTKGADGVELPGRVDVPLYRGPSTHYLPTVAVALPVEGQAALRHTLAVVDLAEGWHRVDPKTASTLGLVPEWTQLKGEWKRITELPRLEIGDVVLEGVHLEVHDDAPGLVLGLATLDELAVALLPSEGVVRFAPAGDAAALLSSIADPLDATAQKGSWTDGDTPRKGNKLTLRVPVGVAFGEAETEAVMHLATAAPRTRLARGAEVPRATQRADVPSHDVTPRIGAAELSPTWAVEADVSDPDEGYLGALGYDVLFDLDIAVAPRLGQVAVARVEAPTWTDATDTALQFARERHAQEEERRPTEAYVEGRVQIGFDGPKRAAIPLGDPGDPVIRDRNLDLAEALWSAGALDDALPFYLAAATHAGDHCLTHLRLGQRRLAWSGTRQAQSFVVDLVEQPLERAGAIWDQWLAIEQSQRIAIWQGQDQPDGSITVYQPVDCAETWGTLAAAARAQGRVDAAKALESRYQSSDLSVGYARALRHLADDEPGTAEGVLRWVLDNTPTFALDGQLALALAVAGRGDAEEAQQIARDIPGYASHDGPGPGDHPLTAAFTMVEAGQAANAADGVARMLLRLDARWVPGHLAVAFATGEAPPPWDASADARYPGSPQVACQKAVHLALSGQVDEADALLDEVRAKGVADYWTARALVAYATGDEEGRAAALQQRALRFPLMPGTTAGTKPVVTDAGDEDDDGADAP